MKKSAFLFAGVCAASALVGAGVSAYVVADRLGSSEASDVYSSILSAIANGRNRITDISQYIHEDRSKVAKYLLTLQTLHFVEKQVPCGESDTDRK